MPARIKLKPARRKYGNEPVVIDGQRFDSKREASRWLVLRELQAAGKVSGLRRQPRLACAVGGVHLCDYVGDFAYTEGGKLRIEDCKGYRNRVYLLKRKLVFALFGIRIRET